MKKSAGQTNPTPGSSSDKPVAQPLTEAHEAFLRADAEELELAMKRHDQAMKERAARRPLFGFTTSV